MQKLLNYRSFQRKIPVQISLWRQPGIAPILLLVRSYQVIVDFFIVKIEENG